MEWTNKHGDLWQIRPIKPSSIVGFRMCCASICNKPATYYIVCKAQGQKTESRSRRCEFHAREFAKNARIPFPGETAL